MTDQGSCKIPGVPQEPVYRGDYSFNTGALKRFSSLDYVLFSAVLIVSASIGFFQAWRDRRKKGLDDYLLAGRSMGPLPVGLSLLASFMSAITLLGTPAEMYNFTTVYFWIGLGYFLVVAGAAHIYIPVFYRLQVTSAYEVRINLKKCGKSVLDLRDVWLRLRLRPQFEMGAFFLQRVSSVQGLSAP